MLRAALTGAVAVAVFLASVAPPARSKHADEGDLLPDLKALKAADVRLRVLPGDVRHLRFTTQVANVQSGPLELQPVADDCNGNGDFADDRTAMQRIYHDDDANGRFTRGIDLTWRYQRAGCFYYHPEHDHWHFEDFANYRLHEFEEDGGLGPPIRSSDKISFCMSDTFRARPRVPGSPRDRYYTQCGADDVSGISVGWADEYHRSFTGQHLDVTGVPDGDYCLVMDADPVDRLEEVDDLENDSQIRITLKGDSVRWRPSRPC